MIKNKILEIKKYFSKYQIDGYVIPKNDEFFSEFDQFDRLKKITNFSGSAGLAVITKNVPLRLYKARIVRPVFFINLLFPIIRLFLSTKMAKRIKILGHDLNELKEVLELQAAFDIFMKQTEIK